MLGWLVNPIHPIRNRRGFLLALLLVLGLVSLGLAGYHWLGLAQTNVAQEAFDYLRSKKPTPLSGSLHDLLADPKLRPVPTQAHPFVGRPAPAFTLVDPDGKSWSLQDLLADGPVVVIFYYGYYCNHCVSQLFDVNEDIERFRELGAHVVAISADPPAETRARFKLYGSFRFPVLSDPGNQVAEEYFVYQPSHPGKEDAMLSHGTFLINRAGKLVWANTGPEPFADNRSLLYELAKMEGKLPVQAQK
jgi:peroxiredoxin